MSMDQAVASNWVLEKFSAASDGFNLIGTTKGYASFSRAFQDGTTVFYAASDDDGNREAGYGVYRGNRLTECVATATLVNGQYNDSNPSRLSFSKGGTIAGTFNAIAFNELWTRDYGAGMVISAKPPEDPMTGMQWLDSTTAEVWIWDEDKWLQFPVGGSGGGVGANVQIEEFPPEYPNVGDMWTDYGTTGELYIWDGRYWVSMTGDGGPKVILGGEEGGAIDLPENITLDNLEDPSHADKALARHISSGGVGKWLPIKTGDVETDPSVTFRDANGRFKSTKKYEDLTDQLKVNRFLAGEIESQGESIANNSEGVEEVKAGIRRIDNQVAENTSNIIQLQDVVDGIEIPDVPDLPEDLATLDDVADAVASEANTRRTADEGLQKEIEDLAETVANLDIPEAVDLDGYATEEWVTEQIEGIDFPETDLTPVEDRLDEIEAVLPREPIVVPPVDIGSSKILIDHPTRPSGAEKPPAEEMWMWHMDADRTGNPANEMKTTVPSEHQGNVNLDGINAVWFKQGNRVQKWSTSNGGWWTGGNLWHLSASSTEGDTLVDGQPFEIYYVDPNTTGDDFVDVISRAESKSDDAELRELIENTRDEFDESQAVQDDKIDELRTDLDQETTDRIKEDNQLAADIEELALILSTISNSIESGFYSYVGNSVPTQPGQFSLAFPDVTTAENVITFNEVDADGTTHNLPATVSVDDYLEIVDQEHPEQFGLWQVTAVPDGSGIFSVQAKMIRAGETFDIGDKCEARFFSVTDALDVNELDARYLKLAGGDMTGKLTTPDIEVKTRDYTSAKLYLHGHRDNSNVESAQIVMHNRYHANAKGTISWLAHTGNNGHFKFDDKVIFGKGQQTNANGFTVKGYISNAAPNGDLLYVYHNNNAKDAVLYKGKQDDDADHLATTSWTVGKIGTAINNIEFPEPDLSDYVSTVDGNQSMKGPLEIHSLGAWAASRVKLEYVTSRSDTETLKLGAPSADDMLSVYKDKVNIKGPFPIRVREIQGSNGAGGTKYTGEYTDDDHIATKKDVEAAIEAIDIPDPDLSAYATEEYVDQKVYQSKFMPGQQVAKTDGSSSNNTGSFWIVDGALYCKVN